MSKKKPKARSPGKLETAIRQSLSKVSVKKLVAMNIPYLIAFYVVEKCAWLYRHCIGGTVVQKLGVMLMNLPVAFRSWIPSFHIRDLLAGIIGALLLRCVVYMKGKNAKSSGRAKNTVLQDGEMKKTLNHLLIRYLKIISS